MHSHRTLALAVVLALGAHAAAQTLPAAQAEIRDLLTQLSAPDFATRQQATERLQALGERVIPALHAARFDPDPERRGRIDTILRALTDLAPEEHARITNVAAAAYQRGDYEAAAANYALLARRVRPTLEECLGHARALQMLTRWPETAAAYLRAADRIDERLAGDPERDPPPVPAVNRDGPMGGGDVRIEGGMGLRGNPGLTDYQRRNLRQERAGLLLFAGTIQRELVHDSQAAAATFARAVVDIPEFQEDFPTALARIVADYPRYLKHENVAPDFSRGLEIYEEMLILDELAATQEKLGRHADAALSFARVISARLRLRPEEMEPAVRSLAGLLREHSELATVPAADTLLGLVRPQAAQVEAVVPPPAVESPFTATATNLGNFGLGPLVVGDVVHLADGRWCAVIGARSRLYLTFSRDLLTWEKPALVPFHPLANNHEPALTVDKEGSVYLAWFANPFSVHPRSSGGYQVWITSSKDGRTFTAPRTIAADTGGWPMGRLQWLATAGGPCRLSWRAAAATADSPGHLAGFEAVKMKAFERPWPMDPFVTQDGGGRFYMVFQENLKGLAFSTSEDGATWADPVLLTHTEQGRVSPQAPQLFLDAERYVLMYQEAGASQVSIGRLGAPTELGPAVRVTAPAVTRWIRSGDEIVGFTPGAAPRRVVATVASLVRPVGLP
jgi:hypothetical protein